MRRSRRPAPGARQEPRPTARAGCAWRRVSAGCVPRRSPLPCRCGRSAGLRPRHRAGRARRAIRRPAWRSRAIRPSGADGAPARRGRPLPQRECERRAPLRTRRPGSGLERGACGVRDVHAGAQAQVRDHGREHQHGFAAVKAQTQLALRRARLFNGKQTHYSASKSSAETSTGLAGAAGCLMRLFWPSIRWARTRASSSAASSG